MILKTMIFIICLIFGPTGNPADAWKEKREEMVRSQLISRGISSREVLDAFRNVPRHLFVPVEYQKLSYSDQPLPIGEGQTISQPYIVAYMTEILDIKPGEKVLEIGTGSGYQAAILKNAGAEVYSVEVIKSLSEKARKTLDNLGYSDIHLKTGDGYEGWAEFAPYDAILVTCSPAEIPSPLIQQLAEGGKMIIPVGEQHSVQFLYLLEKKEGKIKQKNVLPVRFVPMVNEKGKNY
jgi:protein-L-isoaspartate(D-aspartate) O-methyltransferase